MNVRHFLGTSAALVVFAISAFAQETVLVFRDEKPAPQTNVMIASTKPDYRSIPVFVASMIRPEGNVEEILLAAISNFRQLGNGGTLTKEDLDKKVAADKRRERVQQLSQLISYDTNFDAKVTKEEVVSVLRGVTKNERPDIDQDKILYERLAQIMQADLNGDGVMSYLEMSTPQKWKGRSTASTRNEPLQSFLEMDIDKNSVVTVDEVIQSVRAVLAFVDIDGDSIISAQEHEPVSKAYSKGKEKDFECSMPAIPDTVRFIVLGNYAGASVPTVTTAGQNDEMSGAEISVQSKGKPLHILFTTFDPMIFRFTGNVDNVQRVYLTSTTGNSGVVGLPREKVSLLPNNCYQQVSNKREIEAAKRAIAEALSRSPDNVAAQYKVGLINIFDDRVEYPNVEGYLEALPPTVMQIDPSQVVSIKPAKKFEILPGEAGLAQLVKEGVLRVHNEKYEVVKPLKRFPAGLFGNKAVTFVVMPGIPIPEGDAGHSCVRQREEDGTEKLIRGTFCGH